MIVRSAYDVRHAWPPEVAASVARHLRRDVPRALFLGAATGVNDALPYARLAPDVKVVASDVDPDFLRELAERAPANVEARRIDLRRLEEVEPADVVVLFFVLHRLPDWRDVLPGLLRLVKRTLYVSEWAGGLIHLANEKGGRESDPVSRLLRRYHELRGGELPELRTSNMSPFLDALRGELRPSCRRDFVWWRWVSVRDVLEMMDEGAYAPFRTDRPDLGRLREEFEPWLDERVELTETLRIHALNRVQETGPGPGIVPPAPPGG